MREQAMKILDGVGDESLGQWEERGASAYHIKRRLTEEEQSSVGVACDIRGSQEADERLQRAWRWLGKRPRFILDFAREEIQEEQAREVGR